MDSAVRRPATPAGRVPLDAAAPADRDCSYRLHHAVYAAEPDQHHENDVGRWSDALDPAFHSPRRGAVTDAGDTLPAPP